MMNRRLYFMLPNVASAEKTADDLLLARIEDRRMHFMAKPGTHLGRLHEAGYSIRNDLLRGAEVGLVSGALLGLVIGAVLYVTQPVGIILQPIIVLAMAVLFGLFGAWSSSMIGIALPNAQLSQFEEEIEQGKVLLIVDVPRDRVDDIRTLLGRTHPEANARGFEPASPVFP
jgi:F0F1-type ATP synthase assembly protein I